MVVQAHLVQPKAQETVQYTLDGKDWQEMKETGRPFYRAVYEATVDSTSLPDGFVYLRVRRSLTGEVRSREFVVANGEAPAPLEADASLTFIVGRVLDAQKRLVPSHMYVDKAPVGKVDVLFNDKVVGVLAPNIREEYSFHIPASNLKKANTLRFRFGKPDDGMNIGSPVLTFQGNPFRDPRDVAVRQVRVAHWGADAANWGGFVVGDGVEGGTFHRKQNVFCFVASGADAGAILF